MHTTTEYSVQVPDAIKETHENCRMCLESLGEFISLDGHFESSSADQISYWDAYNFCTNLNAQQTDCLPKTICIQCAENLKFVFDVLKKAAHSNEVLREVLGKQLVIERLEKEYEEFDEEKVIREFAEESNDDADDDGCDNAEVEELIYFDETTRPPEDDDSTSQDEFTCGLCEGVFPNEKDLLQHITAHNEKQSSEPDLSENPLKEETQFEDLPVKSSKRSCKKRPTKKIMCEICGKQFASNQVLKMHNLVHTKEKNFPCNLCSKRYATIFRHREHMKSHANIRPHECNLCNQKFFSKHTLVCHMRRHTGERPYKCEICGKTFTQSSILKTHAALHMGKTVECPHCHKRFSRPSHLILHQRTHTGERPYVCHLCSNSYKQKSHLDRHLDTHMGVKHPCEICGKKYTKKSSLNTHMYVHADTKPFQCDVCSIGFATKDKYQRHLKNNHKTTIKNETSNCSNCTPVSEENAVDDPREEILS